MSDREQIQNYLHTLDRYLARLPKEDANEVLKEIESHIYDAIELAESQGEQIDVSGLLQGFGSPRQLAEQYIDHMLEGTPPPDGFSALTSVKHKATTGIYWSTLLLGYGLSLCLMLLAVAKIVSPELVGVWPSEGGQSVIVGVIDVDSQPSNELLQGWLVPVAIVLGALVARLTYKLLQILKRLAG